MKTHPSVNKLIALIGPLMLSTLDALAEESGTGHYDPGQAARTSLTRCLKSDYVWVKVALVILTRPQNTIRHAILNAILVAVLYLP